MLCDVRHLLAAACMTALLLSATMAQAGSYLQSEGDLNYSTGLGYLSGNKDWDSRGHLQDLGCTSEYAYLSQYMEYGYSYYYTLYGGVNLARSRCGNESTTGFGDIRAGVRGRLDQTRNNRAWELELNIPTSSDDSGRSRLGCGAFGLAANVAAKEKVGPTVSLGAEAGVQIWEAPLSHQAEGRLSAGGPIGERRSSPWSWGAGLVGQGPLTNRGASLANNVSDCGTTGKVVRGSLKLGYQVSPLSSVECGNSLGLWGEDSTKRIGFFCGYSHLFKR